MQDINQLIIFARAPVLGGVKQRLARDIGESAAQAFYCNTLQSLLRRLVGGPWQLSVSVARSGDEHHPVFDGLATSVQTPGDLGQRMKRCLEHYPGQRRVIIGSYIPMIERAHIKAAFNALQRHDLVFGPATDGGFWLIGCSENYPASNPGHTDFMSGVRWSGEYALADTIATLSPQMQSGVARISTLSDVDDGPSYRAFLANHAAQGACVDETKRGRSPGNSGND